MNSKRNSNFPNGTFSVATLVMIIGGIAVLLSGCEKQTNLNYVIVSGKVTWQGKPLPKGMIRFIPIASTKGPTSAAEIIQGHYEIVTRGGVPVGEHRVEITSGQSNNQAQQMATPADVGSTQTSQFIPPEYNRKSKLTANIESGMEKVTLDYDLR